MYKSLTKLIFYITILIFIALGYLSFFGIKTDKFNNLISKSIDSRFNSVKINLDNIYLKLSPLKLNLTISTQDPVIEIGKSKINIKKISSKILLRDLINDNKTISNLIIEGKNNNINDIIKILRFYQNNFQTMLIDKLIKSGQVKFIAKLNFDNNGNIKDDFNITGEVNKLNIELINKNKILSNFNFNIINKNFKINKSNYLFNNIKFDSENIQIIKQKNGYKIEGNLNNNRENFDKKYLQFFFKESEKFIKNKSLEISSKNKFSFLLNKNFIIKYLKLESSFNINEIKVSNKYNIINNVLNINDDIYLKNNLVNIYFEGNPREKNKKNLLKIKGEGNYGSSLILDKYKINYESKNSLSRVSTNFEILNHSIFLETFGYEKDIGVKGNLETNMIINNESYKINKIFFTSKDNYIEVNNLNLSKKMKIKSFDLIEGNFSNINDLKNSFKIKKKNNNYFITGKLLDGTAIVNAILENENQNKTYLFERLNNKFYIDINKFYFDQSSHVNNLKGLIEYDDNKITKLVLDSYFDNNEILKLKIATNDQGEQITNLYTRYPKPLIKRYKFIKGFDDGVLDLQSIKKNNVSNTVLIIDNFKVKEVPILAKLLTLASLQGIADLLTGEGVRFTDFEMRSKKKGNLTEISEIYAIGPAVSLMMEGYIEKNKITSLRGTLVPATTINRTISSIPILGDILVGKKVGEGVFGVSFKIKGPPKNLKTTVNPVKTLTPRFITRTLEKIKN